MTLNSIYIINWGERWALPNSAGGLSIRVKGRKATVNIGSDITFLIEKRKGSSTEPVNLELVVENQSGLSRNAEGLMVRIGTRKY